MILCDLPYGVTHCKWDNIIPFVPLWEQYERITKENAAIVLFGCEPFSTKLRWSNLKKYRYDWYWKKKNATGATFAKVQPMRKIENVCVFYKKKPTYNPQGLVRLDKPIINKAVKHKVYNGGRNESIQKYTNYPTHLLDFKRDKTQFHPTQKPTELCEYLIRTYTNEGETVLDNCMGSGTTGVACVNTKRKFIGIEIDKDYFKIAEKRINLKLERSISECQTH